MAKKGGYGADPTLVSAAFRLGQSYVPKDYSSIFARQYEGMIAGYKARYKAMGEGMKSIGEGTGKLLRRDADIKDKFAEETYELDQGLGFNDGLNEIATTYNTGVQEEQKNAYDNNDQFPNAAVFDAEKEQFEKIKDQIEKLNKKGIFLGKKGKQKRVDLVRKALKLRDYINTTRGNDKAFNESSRSLLIDRMLTHKDNPDLQFLLAEKTKKDGDLRDIGVTVFFDENNKKQYRYPVGLAAQIYNKIQKDKDINLEEEYRKESLLGEITVGGGDGGEIEYLTVSEEQLYEGVVYKDDASRNVIRDGHVGEVKKAALELNGDLLAVKNYDDIKTLTKQNIEATLKDSSSYQNLTNEGILIGNTTISWSKELNDGLAIDEIIINQEGLGSDILAMADLNGDRVIDETEFEKLKAEKGKHDEARALIIDKLLNPQTPQEKELSIDAYSEFISDKTRQVFNSTREQMGYVYNEENQTWTMPNDKDPIWEQLGFSNIDQYQKSDYYKANVLGLTPEEIKGKAEDRAIEFDFYSGAKDEQGNNIAVKRKTTSYELINLDSQLSDLMSKSSFNTESYVDIFGQRIGYFPDKGFTKVRLATKEDVKNKKFEKALGRPVKVGEIIRVNPGSDVAYWKNPKDVFRHYSIPTTYNKSSVNTSFNSNKE